MSVELVARRREHFGDNEDRLVTGSGDSDWRCFTKRDTGAAAKLTAVMKMKTRPWR